MGHDRYFLLATLPALGDLGCAPPVGLAELLDHAGDAGRTNRLLAALLLADDLVQREAFLAGEIVDVEPVVLSEEAIRNQAGLPEYLLSLDEPRDGTAEADTVWEAYFRYLTQLGLREGNSLLPRWVSFEVGLRNALVGERARRLGLNEADYLVAEDLAEQDQDYGEAVRSWAAAATPLDGHRELIRFRWNWLEKHDAWFSFSEDELLIYAARLMLLEQWQRIGEKAASGPGKSPGRFNTYETSVHEDGAS